MSATLPVLENERSRLVQGLAELGDLRAGSITAVVRRCGKPSCHCAQAKDRGHGPHLRLTYKRAGKTVSEALPSTAARRKAEREIAEFRKFEQIRDAFLEVNRKICRLRPVPEDGQEEAPRLEKKRRKRSSRKSPAKSLSFWK